MQLPNVETLDGYRAIYHREDLWRPVIEKICGRHCLPEDSCVRGPDGTHIVYLVGSSSVVKLFVPLFAQDFVVERSVGGLLEGRLGVATPAVLAEGEIGGWRYLVMTRVPGRPLGEVWSDMSRCDHERIVAQIGNLIARVRAAPLEGLESLPPDWGAFLRSQAAAAAARHQVPGMLWNPARDIPPYIKSSELLESEGPEPVLLLCDITGEHVMVSRSGDSWRMVSYVDFGDAMVGHPEYELVAPGVDVVRGDRGLLRTLLFAAGYVEEELDERFRQRLMAYTLIHRYVMLGDVMAVVPGASAAASLEDLANAVWPVCQE